MWVVYLNFEIKVTLYEKKMGPKPMSFQKSISSKTRFCPMVFLTHKKTLYLHIPIVSARIYPQ